MLKKRSVVTVDTFLQIAEKRLRGHMPAGRVQEVLNEVGSHFSDRMEDLQSAGLPMPESEASAVALFGKPQEWANSIVDSAYADNFTSNASLITTCSVAIFFLTLAIMPLLLHLSLYAIAALVAVMASGAFRARKRHTVSIIKLGFVVAVLSFVISGAVSIPVVPGVIAVTPSIFKSVTGLFDSFAKAQNQSINMLNAGWRTYMVGTAPVKVPSELRTGAGYIVPLTPNSNSSSVSIFCRHSFSIDPFNVSVTSDLATSPYRTVATEREAATIWRADAPAWRLIAKDDDDVKDFAVEIRQSYKRAGWFDLYAALPGVWIVLLNLPLLLLLDVIAATMGRIVYRMLRRKSFSMG